MSAIYGLCRAMWSPPSVEEFYVMAWLDEDDDVPLVGPLLRDDADAVVTALAAEHVPVPCVRCGHLPLQGEECYCPEWPALTQLVTPWWQEAVEA